MSLLLLFLRFLIAWLLPVLVSAGFFSSSSDNQPTTTIVQDERVIDLDVYNMEPTILAHNWTCVVFYDGLDEPQREQTTHLMNDMVAEFSDPHHAQRFDLGFATLDIRRHLVYRQSYEFPSERAKPFIYTFYRDFPDFDTPVVLQPRTFMNLRGDVYFPSSVVLFANDFNVYARVNWNTNYNADLYHKIDVVANWLETLTPNQPHEVVPHILSPANKDREDAAYERDNSFNFDNYREYIKHKEQMELEEQHSSTNNQLGPRQQYLMDLKYGKKNNQTQDNNNIVLDQLGPREQYLKEQTTKTAKIVLEQDGTISSSPPSDDRDDEEGDEPQTTPPVVAPEPPALDDMRFLLEAGARRNTDVEKKGAFRYPRPVRAKYEYDESPALLRELTDLIQRYLTWVEAWEDLWSEERKQRENEHTKFGVHLTQMNAAVELLFQQVFDPDYIAQRRKQTEPKPGRPEPLHEQQERKDLGLSLEQWTLRKKRRHFKNDRIPTEFHTYLNEMILNLGRTPKRLREYFRDKMLLPLGKTAAERREARKKVGAHIAFALVERLRDYMHIWSDVLEDGERYKSVLSILVLRWENILIDFHNKLTISYQHYLEEHPEDPGNSGTFPFQPMDLLDMQDPNNAELLSDYDEFSKRYTEAGIPVILGNVNMTNHEWSLDYLVETCGHMWVTASVKWSNPVGAKSGKGWGGLKDYHLHRSLMNENRKTRRDTEEEDEDEHEDESASADGSAEMSADEAFATEAFMKDEDHDVIKYDRSLTFAQFVALSAEIPELYLHDQSMPDGCELAFHRNTPYDVEQLFRLPYVIGSYDYFQRLPLLGWTQSWPSLFVGKKGSNSKLHIDAGGSGFFMYLVKGRKRWVVYNRSERPYLYEEQPRFIPDVLGMGKSPEANEFLSKRFPLLHRAAEGGYEIIQQPGQLVWIPPNCPHAVENLDDIIGIAMNMIPEFGFGEYLHDAIHNERKFGDIEQLLKYMMFQDHADEPFPSKDPLYSTFAEYKGQW